MSVRFQQHVTEFLADLEKAAMLIPGTSSAVNIPSASPREAATDRITIRLRPGDGAALDARAARRRMKTSNYLAALVRSHIAANAVLTADELETVKQAVVVLAGVGRDRRRHLESFDNVASESGATTVFGLYGHPVAAPVATYGAPRAGAP